MRVTLFLYALYRWLYWTDIGSRTIEKMSMDGHARMALHDTNLQTPYALSIDYTTQTLYWADSTLNKLESSRTDGTNRKSLNTNLGDPYAMAFFDGRLYMTDVGNDGIFSTMSTAQSSITPLILLPDPYGIQIVDEGIQFKGTCYIHCLTIMLYNNMCELYAFNM